MRTKTKHVLTGMILFSVFLAVATAVLFFLHYRYLKAWMLSTAITFLTVFYHFAMRLIVGEVVTLTFRGREFPQDRMGFRIHAFEKDLYKKLRVQKWKTDVLTAKPEQFDLNAVAPEELLHNVMQAELVHRIIMVLSFVPLLFIIPFGAPVVFVITSIAACIIDCIFVIIQRYNRPKVLKYIALMNRRGSR